MYMAYLPKKGLGLLAQAERTCNLPRQPGAEGGILDPTMPHPRPVPTLDVPTLDVPTLNIDLGELGDAEPEALYAMADVVNVACGGHAGDEASMRRACALAKAHGCAIAAHPSYPDRAGFGRASMATTLDAEALRASIEAQCAALAAIAGALGLSIGAVKPHGALYHDAARLDAVAAAVLAGAEAALASHPLAFVAQGADGALARRAAKAGHRVLREGFADRGYGEDGAILPRGAPGALLQDPAAAAEQARALVASGRFDTLCVHGDTEGAVAVATAVRRALDAERGA
jgi:UPF0271 protein